MSTARRDLLFQLQGESQKKWADLKVFEEDAGVANAGEEKYLVTFPYPYCNGYLHLGHAFTISKPEFVVSYKRLKGVKCLYPFGFHCTGMPIQACANKLKGEFEKYGKPPVFPIEASEDEQKEAKQDAATAGKSRAKKGKVASKASKKKFQWEILRESNVPSEQCLQFADPVAWLDYFPTQNANDLKAFGLKSDWRRTFITTDVNPYYDSFIRWQFNKLRANQKVKFGKRSAIYSQLDGQPCADHDRASGEQVQPQEYTLIKMKVLALPDASESRKLEGRDVYLPAATLRPETMYGQTNCWVLPSGDYIAFEVTNGDVYIASERSARNMAYQDFFTTYGKFKVLANFSGSDLIGLPLKSPHAQFERIFVLPLLTVNMTKGTGIVTSVPSDAPDDYRGLMDLKKKPDLRQKFGVKDEWILPFEPIPIIETPGFGSLAAVEACERYKITSQNNKAKLAVAKAEVYKAGFYSGTMLVGSMAGESVVNAKPAIRKQMIAENFACGYFEPEKEVISRSGDECVVALCDQWYLEYGEPSWRAQVEECLTDMNLYAEEARRAFESVVGWLREWACSRQFGLGSKLPWDKSWLIESLSDSTIYMAYYTVVHLLQGGLDNIDGKKVGPAGVSAEAMTDAVWDFIMLGKGTSTSPELSHIDSVMLEKMRNEFLYWYPVDLRVSGKDLIGNHLTFYLYNHTAIFGKEHWPRGIRVNGHILLNAEKMSKSTGNFLTLRQAMEKFSADGVRFALADAGDTVEDANFSLKTADDAVLKLYVLVEFVKQGLSCISSMRSGPVTEFADRVFIEQLKRHLIDADEAYDQTAFREALKAGFFETSNDLGKYRESVNADKRETVHNMHRDVFLKYVYLQIFMLVPICPHTCEHLWGISHELLCEFTGNDLPSTVMRGSWPVMEAPNESIIASSDYLNDVLSRIRAFLVKSMKKRKGNSPRPEKRDTIKIFVCKDPTRWQRMVLDTLRSLFEEDAWVSSREEYGDDEAKWWKYPPTTPKEIAYALPKEYKKKAMPYVAMIRKDIEKRGLLAFDRSLPYDETEVLQSNIEFVKNSLSIYDIQHVFIGNVKDAEDAALVKDACPGSPAFVCSTAA